MQIFSANMDRISRHNARYMKGEVTYSMGIQQVAQGYRIHRCQRTCFHGTSRLPAPRQRRLERLRLRQRCYGRNVDQENRPNGPHERTEPYGLLHSKLWMQRWSCTVRSQLRETESSYPYEGRQGSCRYSSAYSAGVSVSGYMSIRRGDESNLLSAVSSNGPVSVCINASSSGFQFYKSGVFNDPYCSSQINHAVLAVGYGSESGGDY